MSTHEAGQKFPRRLAAVIAAALLLHALILGGAEWVWPANAPPPVPTGALQVRVVEPPTPVATQSVAVAEALPPVVPAPVQSRSYPKPITPARRAPAAEAPALPAPVTLPPAVTMAAVTPATDEEAIPLYRTRLPPAATLRYDVKRGALHGTGELVWRPQGDRYELALDFKLSGLTILSQLSSGGIDAAGIAPLRFTDRRARRGTTAANFQRLADAAGGKITYSGSPGEFALKPGAQDRLSWMLQLAAIVSAEAALALPDARVVMQVTGSRGDAGVWVFRCAGPERVDARGAAVEALKFVREPREAYDTTVQVWLDPAQGHLPVRATQKSGEHDEGYELRLVDVASPN